MIPAARGVASTSSILKYELVSEDGRGGGGAKLGSFPVLILTSKMEYGVTSEE